MSFNGELAGFARGINAGSTLGSRMIQGRIDKEKLRDMKPATDADTAGTPSPFGAGPQVGTATTDATHTSSTSSGGHALTGGPGGQTPGQPNDIYNGFMKGAKSVINNPFGLAAIAATGKSESGWSPGNLNRTWNDPSQSGAAGTSGGLMSWRGPRLQALQAFAKSRGETGNGSAETQGAFFAQENPDLVARLNAATSPQEAADAMANAWRFAGFDNPNTGEAARRRSLTQNYYAQEYKDYKGDIGGAPAVAGAGVLPEEDEADTPSAGEEDEEEQAGYIDPGEISVTPVEKPVIQAPQVAQAFPGEQDPYKLYAAKGGVIPEFDEGGITQDFNNGINSIAPVGQAAAGEGANNSGIVDPATGNAGNPGASFEGGDDWNIFHSGTGNSQGLGSGSGTNIFTMEQLNDPTPEPETPAAVAPPPVVAPPPAVVAPVGTPAPAAPAAKTPAQIAWEKLQNAPKPKPVAPAAPKYNNTIAEDRLRTAYAAYAKANTRNPESRDHWTGRAQRPMTYKQWMNQNYGGYTQIPGTSNWGVKAAEGGVIPEFAEGGMVSFDELLKQEKGNRDAAAKRFNAQKGGPTSSAYDPDGFWEKKPPAAAKPAGGVSAPASARPDKGTTTRSVKPAAKTNPIEQQRKEQREVRAKPQAAPQVSPIEEQRREQRENRPGNRPPNVPAAGTPTAGYDPKPAVGPQAPGQTAVSSPAGKLGPGDILADTVRRSLPVMPTSDDIAGVTSPDTDPALVGGDPLPATPSAAVGATSPDTDPTSTVEPDPYKKPVIPDDRDTRETSSAPQWQDPYIPVPSGPASPPPPAGTIPQVEPRANPQLMYPPEKEGPALPEGLRPRPPARPDLPVSPSQDPLAAINRSPRTSLPPPRPAPAAPAAPAVTAPVPAPSEDPLASIARGPRDTAPPEESGIIPEEDRDTRDVSVQPLPRPDPSQAEPQMPPPPRLVSKGAGAPPALVKRFQDMMAQAPSPQAQQRIAREAVKYGLRFVFDDWGDRYVAPGGLGFAEGGVVPEEDEPVMQSQHQPNYLTSPSAEASGNAQDAAPRETVALRPTEKMRNTLTQAVDTGIDYLNKAFGRGGGGANGGVMPEGSNDGPMRMARGEGAATPEEINAIDDEIDPNREMSEGDRHMTRVAKSVSWYLEQGRPEDAAAASASLLMYGAGRAQKLGTLAAAAYEAGDMERAAKFIEKAYETIPDASSLDIQLTPDGQGFVMNKVGPDGESQQIDIGPEQLPQVIRGMQDNSLYWQQIQRLADPATFRTQLQDKQQDKRDLTKRGEALSDDARDRERTLTDAETARKNAAAIAKSTRELKLQDTDAANKEAERRIRLTNELKGATVPDMDQINPLRGQYTELLKTKPEDITDGSEESANWVAQRDEILSRISDAVPKGQGGKWIGENMNVLNWNYIAPPDGGASNATAPTPVGEPQGPNKYGKWGQKYSDGTFKEVPAPAG